MTGKGRHTGRVLLRRNGNIPPLPWLCSFDPPFASGTEKDGFVLKLGPDRLSDAGLGQTLGVANGEILRPSVAVVTPHASQDSRRVRSQSNGDLGGGLKSYASGASATTRSSNLAALPLAKLRARSTASARESQNAASRRLY